MSSVRRLSHTSGRQSLSTRFVTHVPHGCDDPGGSGRKVNSFTGNEWFTWKVNLFTGNLISSKQDIISSKLRVDIVSVCPSVMSCLVCVCTWVSRLEGQEVWWEWKMKMETGFYVPQHLANDHHRLFTFQFWWCTECHFHDVGDDYGPSHSISVGRWVCLHLCVDFLSVSFCFPDVFSTEVCRRRRNHPC